MNRLRLSIAVITMTVLVVGFAVVATAGSGTVRVHVSNVTDNRSTNSFFSRCELELTVMGRSIAEALGIRRMRVKYAVDDTGLILNDPKNQGTTFFQLNDKKERKLTHKLELKSPARAAESIRSVRGEVELFKPTDENGGKVVIPNFMTRPGVPLDADRLKPWNVELRYVTREFYEAEKKARLQEAKNRELEKLGEQMGEAMLQMFEGMFGAMMDSKNSLYFMVKDPDGRVVTLDFLDSEGHRFKSQSRSNMGEVRSVGFKDLPPKDLQLVIYIASPDAVETHPFVLENIALP